MKRKILVVEDNEINRKLLTEMLKADYDVLEACDGEEAMELMEEKHNNLSAVVLDLLMPKMSGMEVLRRMKKSEKLRQIPVIVATGTNDTQIEEEALIAGANDYVLKPYNLNVLRNRLSNIVLLREQAAIVNATRIDALTGLYSRNTFFEKVARIIHTQDPGYFVMGCFDIERFKVINDLYGTEKGDEVLKQLTAIFREGFETNGGICCRVMADNFAVLYPKKQFNEAILGEIRRKAELLDGSIQPITYSIGRYVVDDLELEPSSMYDRAVLAKETIKGRYNEHIAVYQESMMNKILEEQTIISQMNRALKEKQFEVWYQPQFNHGTGTLIGAEALVRWNHPNQGIVAPISFIPLFEKNGFVYEVDKYVWEAACIFLKEMIDSGRTVIPISVNVSRYDMFRDDMIKVLSDLIRKYEIPAHLLRLEITESAFSKSAEQLIVAMKQLKQLGFIIEIDDFGTGYSSLSTLQNVPSDVLKLDMKFLEVGENEEKGKYIVEFVVGMAKRVGMTVIAEGVEEREQADFLKSVGCDNIQGYLYSKPLPKAEYEKVLLLHQGT